MEDRTIRPAREALDATVDAPPSKSVTHRALVVAALASGPSVLRSALDADDTRRTLNGLEALGVRLAAGSRGWKVEGVSGRVAGGVRLDLGESGTSLRFLVAVAALGAAVSELDGGERLRERPIRELADALCVLGGDVRPGPSTGGLPVRAGGRPPRGGRVRVASSRSSQFASALLLVAPRLPEGLELTLDSPVASLPYVELTAAVLSDFGVAVERRGERHFAIARQDYAGRDYAIEGDHSSSSYFLAAACAIGGRVRARGLRASSAQADARLGSLLEALGCEVRRGGDWVEVRGNGRIPPFDLDLRDAPDLVPTVAMLALFAEGPCSIRGVAHLRLKESDRLEVLARNLRTLGRAAVAEADGLRIGEPSFQPCGGRIATASDHRIAMAFAIAGLRQEGVRIQDPGCVAKSNPRFWEQFAEIEGR